MRAVSLHGWIYGVPGSGAYARLRGRVAPPTAIRSLHGPTAVLSAVARSAVLFFESVPAFCARDRLTARCSARCCLAATNGTVLARSPDNDQNEHERAKRNRACR